MISTSWLPVGAASRRDFTIASRRVAAPTSVADLKYVACHYLGLAISQNK